MAAAPPPARRMLSIAEFQQHYQKLLRAQSRRAASASNPRLDLGDLRVLAEFESIEAAIAGKLKEHRAKRAREPEPTGKDLIVKKKLERKKALKARTAAATHRACLEQAAQAAAAVAAACEQAAVAARAAAAALEPLPAAAAAVAATAAPGDILPSAGDILRRRQDVHRGSGRDSAVSVQRHEMSELQRQILALTSDQVANLDPQHRTIYNNVMAQIKAQRAQASQAAAAAATAAAATAAAASAAAAAAAPSLEQQNDIRRRHHDGSGDEGDDDEEEPPPQPSAPPPSGGGTAAAGGGGGAAADASSAGAGVDEMGIASKAVDVVKLRSDEVRASSRVPASIATPIYSTLTAVRGRQPILTIQIYFAGRGAESPAQVRPPPFPPNPYPPIP